MRLLNYIFSVLHFNRKNWRAISLCVLAATIFWFFNALNKSYTTTVSFPLRFDYDSRHYIPIQPLQDELRINVTGMGWDIFRRTIGLREQPLVIPLDRPSNVKKIVGSTLPALFSSQLEAFQINFIVSDTVYIDIQPKGRRWITLSSDSIPKFIDTNYGIIGDINIIPDSILIEGPLDYITQIKEPYSVQPDRSEIDDDFDEEIEINLPNGALISSVPSHVEVSFSVERFVEVTDSVKLQLVNIPKNAQPKMDIDKLPVRLRFRQSQIAAFPWDSLRAVVDLTEFTRGNIEVLPAVTGLPAYTDLIDIDTIHITY